MFNAKHIAPLEQNSDRYELYTVQTIKDINGIDVQVPQSIGTYSIAELEAQKVSFQEQIDIIDEKIKAINELTA
jgi:hypothetical protein